MIDARSVDLGLMIHRCAHKKKMPRNPHLEKNLTKLNQLNEYILYIFINILFYFYSSRRMKWNMFRSLIYLTFLIERRKIKVIRGTTRPNFEEYNSEIEIK